MKLLAFDPSMTCTGWAIIQRHPGGADQGDLVEAGTITTDALESDDHVARVQLIAREVKALIDDEEPQTVALELPSPFVQKQERTRRRSGQPAYGMAVGAVIAAAGIPFNLKTCRPITPPSVVGWPPNVWTRGLPPGVRSTRDDRNKAVRVEYAARLYSRRPEDFGAKTRAGDVADAVLIGRYAMLVNVSDGLMQQWRALT